MNEQAMTAALNGHFYRMNYSRDGIVVMDVKSPDTKEYQEAEDPDTPLRGVRKYVKPGTIDWGDKDKSIIEMRNGGASFKHIGRTLGINDATARWRYIRLCNFYGYDIDTSCISLRKFSPEVEAEIVKARDAGETLKSIGQRYGLTKSGVWVIYTRWYSQKKSQEAA